MTALEDSPVQLQLAMHSRTECFYSESRQGQHPPDIPRCNKMPGRSQYMRSQDLSFIESLLNAGVCPGWLLFPVRPRLPITRRQSCICPLFPIPLPFQAVPDRPFRTGKILGLDATQPAYHPFRRHGPGSADLLVLQPPADNSFFSYHITNLLPLSVNPMAVGFY